MSCAGIFIASKEEIISMEIAITMNMCSQKYVLINNCITHRK